MSMLFAATYPDRTTALVLYAAFSHFGPEVLSPEDRAAFLDIVQNRWGAGETLKVFAPGKLQDEHSKRWWAKFERLGGSPSAVMARRA